MTGHIMHSCTMHFLPAPELLPAAPPPSYRNCEDVAMSLLVANMTGAAPLWVPASSVVDLGQGLRGVRGISSAGSHHQVRGGTGLPYHALPCKGGGRGGAAAVLRAACCMLHTAHKQCAGSLCHVSLSAAHIAVPGSRPVHCVLPTGSNEVPMCCYCRRPGSAAWMRLPSCMAACP